ncbi:hypothetical protein [Streptomyces sp. NPDC001068]|uniref:hypothetical protein n=1 Tax=Streptomyces sp. NPDC001068 TaxID=3364544 RepID=UPI00367C5BF2
MKRRRAALPAALGVAAALATGCGGSSDGSSGKGLPVRLLNDSTWNAHVLGCPSCGSRGVVVQGDVQPTRGGTAAPTSGGPRDARGP